MPEPGGPWQPPNAPYIPDSRRQVEEASQRSLDHATRDPQGRPATPDASAPRESAAYRAAVLRDLMGRGLSKADATTVILAGLSAPAAGVQVQARAVTDQARETRARTERERDALIREQDQERGRDR